MQEYGMDKVCQAYTQLIGELGKDGIGSVLNMFHWSDSEVSEQADKGMTTDNGLAIYYLLTIEFKLMQW